VFAESGCLQTGGDLQRIYGRSTGGGQVGRQRNAGDRHPDDPVWTRLGNDGAGGEIPRTLGWPIGRVDRDHWISAAERLESGTEHVERSESEDID
jgi:hypothetical protein